MSAVCMEWFLVTDFFMFYFLHLAASETPEKVPLFRSGLNAWKKKWASIKGYTNHRHWIHHGMWIFYLTQEQKAMDISNWGHVENILPLHVHETCCCRRPPPPTMKYCVEISLYLCILSWTCERNAKKKTAININIHNWYCRRRRWSWS